MRIEGPSVCSGSTCFTVSGQSPSERCRFEALTATKIGGVADQFHFAFMQLSGAGSIVAKVERVLNSDVWAKAGVMIRQSLDAGSVHGMMIVSPASGVAFQRRTTADAASVGALVEAAIESLVALQRAGRAAAHAR